MKKRTWVSLFVFSMVLAVVAWGATGADVESPWTETGRDAAKILTPTAALALLFGKLAARYANQFEENYKVEQNIIRQQIASMAAAIGDIRVQMAAQDATADGYALASQLADEQVREELAAIREQFAGTPVVNALQSRVSALELRQMVR